MEAWQGDRGQEGKEAGAASQGVRRQSLGKSLIHTPRQGRAGAGVGRQKGTSSEGCSLGF